ncbi:hypothetical protein PAXINDRAFT_19772 [Paxillus involutus ATCC 200175]|uniref:Ras-GAP domain-containing protein n=1 Tax=Paxillus involutus ATCC 200175 TaxID=664439 RepID=A0A0C9T726_PAXIN|nr:hypothetical protein PAXINDRAFT_19772 [Paxillus involutus ATCC 200175]
MPPGHAYDLDPVKTPKPPPCPTFHRKSSFDPSRSHHLPQRMFREVCAHLAKALHQVWPESKFAALGASIFLCFISHVIFAPEVVDDDSVIRRGLLVVAKVMKNLANNISSPRRRT